MLQYKPKHCPEINTERLLLRRFEHTDLQALYHLRSDEQVLQYIHKAPMKNMEEAAVFLADLHSSQREGNKFFWAITDLQSKNVLGSVCIWNIQHAHYRAELGYALLPAYHGLGIMQEAVKAVLHFGFGTMGLHSIEAHINPLNLRSRKVLEKMNFKAEAYFKENYFYEGKFYDTAVYSLLAADENLDNRM